MNLSKADDKTLAVIEKQIREDLKHIIKVKKTRTDKGKSRNNYKSSLPLIYRTYINRANKKSIEFALTLEQFNAITSSSCVFCGASNKIGIDRIDSGQGYTIDNCQPACNRCNLMKYTFTSDEFIKHISKILKHLKVNLD